MSMTINGRRALTIVREHRGWTQAEVGRRMGGVDKSAISRFETGVRQLDLETLDELLRALDLTPRQYCRVIDVLEEAGEQIAAYQVALPFQELGEPAAAAQGDRTGSLGDPELDLAARNLMEGVHRLLRSHYRAQLAGAPRDKTTGRAPRARKP